MCIEWWLVKYPVDSFLVIPKEGFQGWQSRVAKTKDSGETTRKEIHRGIDPQINVSFSFLQHGFEFRDSTLSYYTSTLFVMGFFQVGSHELFAWVGFEL
jgi:hypothetical protein